MIQLTVENMYQWSLRKRATWAVMMYLNNNLISCNNNPNLISWITSNSGLFESGLLGLFHPAASLAPDMPGGGTWMGGFPPFVFIFHSQIYP